MREKSTKLTKTADCLRRTLSEQLGYFKAGRGANVVKAAVTFLYSVGWVLILNNAAGGP